LESLSLREKSGLSFNSNQLKTLALVLMFFDHFIALFLRGNELFEILLRLPGRICAPIMCYMIAEGFKYTKDVKKYALRLFIFAAVSHIPFNLCFGFSFFQATSIIWALAMGLTALYVCTRDNIHIAIKVIAVILCCGLSYTANWNYVAVLWILFFGLFKDNFKLQMVSFTVIGLVFHLGPIMLRAIMNADISHLYQMGIFISIPLFCLYNGKRGSNSLFSKWFFYIFYPLHLIILYLLRVFTPMRDIVSSIF